MAGLTFVLAALSWLGPFSIDTYLPSLPSISKSLSASAAQVQQTMTAFLVFFAFMSLWHGAISDAYGRRRLTLIALPFFRGVARLRDGRQRALSVVLPRPAGRDGGRRHGRRAGRRARPVRRGGGAAAHVACGDHLHDCAVVAPVAGGYLQSWFGWRSIFILLILLSDFPSDRILALAAGDSASRTSDNRWQPDISRAPTGK